jgi:hypothetical protein
MWKNQMRQAAGDVRNGHLHCKVLVVEGEFATFAKQHSLDVVGTASLA